MTNVNRRFEWIHLRSEGWIEELRESYVTCITRLFDSHWRGWWALLAAQQSTLQSISLWLTERKGKKHADSSEKLRAEQGITNGPLRVLVLFAHIYQVVTGRKRGPGETFPRAQLCIVDTAHHSADCVCNKKKKPRWMLHQIAEWGWALAFDERKSLRTCAWCSEREVVGTRI